MVNVAIVGTGKKAQRHFQLWSQIGGTVVTEVMQSDFTMDTWPQNLQVKMLKDVSDMQAEIIDICVPLAEKAYWVQQVAKADAHIICETPLASTAKEAAAIAATCEAKSAHLYTRTSKQFSPAYTNAAKQVASDNIGKHGVTRLSKTKAHPGNKAGDIFISLGTEVFAWLTETFGEVERVTAKHVKEVRKDGSPVEYGLVSIRMKDQSFAHVELSWASNEEKDSFELSGNKGMLTHDSKDSLPVELSLSSEKTMHTETILPKTALHHKLETVADQVRAGVEPEISINSIVQPIQIAEAALQSAQTGQPVLLKEVH